MCQLCVQRDMKHLGSLESIQEATPRATLTHLSCSPNFSRASYLDERTPDTRINQVTRTGKNKEEVLTFTLTLHSLTRYSVDCNTEVAKAEKISQTFSLLFDCRSDKSEFWQYSSLFLSGGDRRKFSDAIFRKSWCFRRLIMSTHNFITRVAVTVMFSAEPKYCLCCDLSLARFS